MVPLTCQFTAELEEPFTVAINCCVPKFATVAVLGETTTVPPEEAVVIVTFAEPDFVASACEVAVTVTCAGLGTVDGAVYSPLAEIVPLAAPPVTLQVTAVFVVPVTLAVNC